MWTVLVHLKNFLSSRTETLDVWSGNSSSFPHPQPCSYPYRSVMAAVDTSWRWHRRASVRPSGPGMSHLACLQSSSQSQWVSMFPSLWIKPNNTPTCGHRECAPWCLLVCWWPLGCWDRKLLWTERAVPLDMYQPMGLLACIGNSVFSYLRSCCVPFTLKRVNWRMRHLCCRMCPC